MEVAGTVDNKSKQIQISKQFPPNTQRFTAAHELGHSLLHDASGLHRDRPLDGSKIEGVRNLVEIQADKFAIYFLMPEKLVRAIFKKLFYTEFFELNDDTYFALGKDAESKIKKNRDLTTIARVLASIEVYNGQHFQSLASQFGVSTQALAIRLEELNLIAG